MNRFLAVGLIVSNIALLNVSPVRAQGMVVETEECVNAISSVENQLQSDRNLTIELSQIEKLQYYPDHPEGRPNGYGLGMSGDAAFSVMGSPVLLNSLSTEVIDSCSSISLVEFGIYQTGNVRTFGLMGDDEVKEFQCPADYDDYPKTDASGQLQFYPRDLVWGESCAN